MIDFSDEDALRELRRMCPGANEVSESGYRLIHLPKLRLPQGNQPAEVEALLCLSTHSGYTSRLFLSQAVPNKGANWTAHRLLDKTWYTWSWQNVSPDQRPAQVLADHLRALR